MSFGMNLVYTVFTRVAVITWEDSVSKEGEGEQEWERGRKEGAVGNFLPSVERAGKLVIWAAIILQILDFLHLLLLNATSH